MSLPQGAYSLFIPHSAFRAMFSIFNTVDNSLNDNEFISSSCFHRTWTEYKWIKLNIFPMDNGAAAYGFQSSAILLIESVSASFGLFNMD